MKNKYEYFTFFWFNNQKPIYKMSVFHQSGFLDLDYFWCYYLFQNNLIPENCQKLIDYYEKNINFNNLFYVRCDKDRVICNNEFGPEVISNIFLYETILKSFNS